MTIPNIPGFTSKPDSLADLWSMPEGDFSEELWPLDALQSMTEFPTEWLVIEQHDYSSTSGSTGVSAFLTDLSGWEEAKKRHDWSARYLGEYLFDEAAKDESGLFETLGTDSSAEFLVQVQRNHNLLPTTVDLSLPFQWFWGAMRNGNNWSYLDSAGNERPLVRSVITAESYQVEVRALELRRYLERRGMVAVLQYDHVIYSNSPKFQTVNHEYSGKWSAFIWTPAHEHIGDGFDSFSRLLGKRMVIGGVSHPNPMALDHDNPERTNYPDFIIGVDAASGRTISFTSNEDELANYFGKNPDAPHYLTPVYFDPKVLNKYRDEPSKYEVSSTRLSCLGLWSVTIGASTTGLIEVYLGDLGRDIPWQEWPHWKANNVPPGGTMSEDRFRRDFLAQWAGEPDTLEAMRDSLVALRQASTESLGWPLIRELDNYGLLDLNGLSLPTTNEQRELLIPVITLSKAFVDAIDERALRSVVSNAVEGDRSLALLEKFVIERGGDANIVQPLRALYRLRSSGGLAHWGGSEASKVFEKLGLSNMTPSEIVLFLATGLTTAMDSIRLLIKK